MVIVLGYSERPEGRAALERATEEAQIRNARLSIIQTLQGGPGENPNFVAEWSERLERLRESGKAIESRLREQGIEADYRLLQDPSQNPGKQILDFAAASKAELIIIGLRRRSPVGKLVLGSVSQSILLGAECPVLAVKAPDAEDHAL